MAEFLPALDFLLPHEGGFVNDPDDPGGATKYGVSLRWLRTVGDLDHDGYLDGDLDHDGDVDAEDIRKMEPGQAAFFYRSQWWDRYGFGRVNDQNIANKLMDLAVNMGTPAAVKCLQRAVRALKETVLSDDGHFGLQTIASVTGCDQGKLLCAFRSEAAGHYRSLPIRNSALSKYLRGWENRAYA